VCVSRVRCRVARGHGVLATVCTVRRSACDITRDGPRSGVARACDIARYNERSGQRGVRGDVTKDHRRCARVSRVRCRAALGIVPNVLWDVAIPLGGGERGVRAACGGGSPVVSPCASVGCAVGWRGGMVSSRRCARCGAVPAISLAWWIMMRRAACCGALLTVPPCMNQLGPLSSRAGYAGPPVVSNCGGSSASQSNYSASSTNYPSTPPAHTYTSSSSPSDAYNPTSTPYSITPHSTSSSTSVHNALTLGQMPLRLLYAYGSSCEWDSQSGESTDEE
jgi:hypothetical protein